MEGYSLVDWMLADKQGLTSGRFIFIQFSLASKSSPLSLQRQSFICLLYFSMMGAVLAVCLAMVLGASFFAYKNLYYAVMKKW